MAGVQVRAFNGDTDLAMSYVWNVFPSGTSVSLSTLKSNAPSELKNNYDYSDVRNYSDWISFSGTLFYDLSTSKTNYINLYYIEKDEPSTFSCTASAGTGIDSAWPSVGSVYEGGSCTFRCTPSRGYVFSYWDGTGGRKTDATFTVSNIYSNQSWTAYGEIAVKISGGNTTANSATIYVSGNSSYPYVRLAYRKTSESSGTYTTWQLIPSSGSIPVSGLESGTRYVFRLYFNDSASGSTQIMSNSIELTTTELTVYTYSMSYSKNTTDGVSNMPSGESAESTAKSHSFTVSSKVPSRTGYNFEGWNLTSGGTGSWYTGGNSGPTLTFDNPSTILYAIWSIKQYTVGATYSPGYSAVFSSISVSSTRVDHGGSAVFTANMATGYIFTGWYDSYGTLVSSDNPYTRTNITQAITLYARGQQNVFTATAHIGNGYERMISSVSANPTSVQYGNTSVFTANLITGYGFSGWYNSSGTLVSSDNPYTATITNNLTLYARAHLKSFVWDNNNNLDNRRPTANEWLRLITFIERKFGKTVSQEAKNSIVVGGTLSASLFNELTSDIGYASTVSRGTPISRTILYNLQNEANR